MKKSDCIYFALLRSALWNETERVTKDVDWKQILETARRQTTMGLVCHAGLQCEAGKSLPEKNKCFLRQQLLSLVQTHQRINAMVARVVTVLRDNGIESVLLKGQGLAANYPVPELRQCGDIDLYVGTENFDAACALVNEMAGEAEAAKGHGYILHYEVAVEGIFIEIHRLTYWFRDSELNAIFHSYSEKGMAAGGSSLLLGGVKVWLPDDTFNALFVFLHAYRHFVSEGVGMRQLCDFAMLLHAECKTVNRNELSEMLVKLNLMDAWQVFGGIAVDLLGLPQDEMPFYKAKFRRRAKCAAGIILKEGNFGREWDMTKKHTAQTGLKRRINTFIRIQLRQGRMFGAFPKLALRQYCNKMLGGLKKIFGMKEIDKRYYKVAGTAFSISAKGLRVMENLMNYVPFEGNQDCECVFDISVEDFNDADKKLYFNEVIEKDAPMISVFRCGKDWLFEMAPTAMQPCCAKLLATPDFSKAKLKLLENADLHFVIDTSCMLMYAFANAAHGILEMHASVIENQGKGYLFLGKSGTGKSTHSRLWLENVPGSRLLNDDNPIVRVQDDGMVWVYGSPWSGKTPCYINKGVPVGGIVKLSQAPENRIRRCALPEAYAALYSSVSGLKMNREMYDGLHETMEKTVVSVPFYHLDCLPDADAAQLSSKTIMK